MRRLGDHLGSTVGSFNKAKAELLKVDKDVVKITDGELKIKLDEVEAPMIDE